MSSSLAPAQPMLAPSEGSALWKLHACPTGERKGDEGGMTTQGSLNRGRRSVLDGAPQKARPGQQESKAGGRAGGERKRRAEDVVLTGEARKRTGKVGRQALTCRGGLLPFYHLCGRHAITTSCQRNAQVTTTQSMPACCVLLRVAAAAAAATLLVPIQSSPVPSSPRCARSSATRRAAPNGSTSAAAGIRPCHRARHRVCP